MRIITFGEIMGRIAPLHNYRFAQSLPGHVEFTFGGGEANVAVSIALQHGEAAFITALPKTTIGYACMDTLRGLGVDVSQIIKTDGRLGLYYLDSGANQLG